MINILATEWNAMYSSLPFPFSGREIQDQGSVGPERQGCLSRRRHPQDLSDKLLNDGISCWAIFPKNGASKLSFKPVHRMLEIEGKERSDKGLEIAAAELKKCLSEANGQRVNLPIEDDGDESVQGESAELTTNPEAEEDADGRIK